MTTHRELNNVYNKDACAPWESEGDMRNQPVSDESRKLYQELHKIARSHRRKWRGNDTLNTTSLIHEAYIKLAPKHGCYANRTHFFASAAKIMRQVLVNYAERASASKRCINPNDIDMEVLIGGQQKNMDDILLIDQIIKKVEKKNERHCRIIECRIFGGMSIEETARAIDISTATVKREWTLISAWMYREIKTSHNRHSPARILVES